MERIESPRAGTRADRARSSESALVALAIVARCHGVAVDPVALAHRHAVASGEAEIGVQQVAELLPVAIERGVHLVEGLEHVAVEIVTGIDLQSLGRVHRPPQAHRRRKDHERIAHDVEEPRAGEQPAEDGHPRGVRALF